MNLKCHVKLNKNWRTEIKAVLLQFVPSAHDVRTRTCAGPSNLDTVNTDCIVKLETFDKGKLYQIPLECCRVVDEWETE